MFNQISLHLFLYGCNIFLWMKTRINYISLFEFDSIKELQCMDVFLICTISMTIVVSVMFAHLSLIAKGYSSASVQAIPVILILMFLFVLICIAYQSTRYHFLKVIRNIILSPFYKVTMVDAFMADQLCSQVPIFRSLGYVTCYYLTGSYKMQDYGFCMRTKSYRYLGNVVSLLPFFWRAMQCLRKWWDEGETSHLINLGKYVSAIVEAIAKMVYEKEKSIGWFTLVLVMSIEATLYQLYWDFVKDWGLLQSNCNNPWLRNELMLQKNYIYFLSMGLNVVFRFAWLPTVLNYYFAGMDYNYRVISLFQAALEVIRRGIWNFHRLEFEYVNNAGKCSVLKIVPLSSREVYQV